MTHNLFVLWTLLVRKIVQLRTMCHSNGFLSALMYVERVPLPNRMTHKICYVLNASACPFLLPCSVHCDSITRKFEKLCFCLTKIYFAVILLQITRKQAQFTNVQLLIQKTWNRPWNEELLERRVRHCAGRAHVDGLDGPMDEESRTWTSDEECWARDSVTFQSATGYP